MSEDWASTEPYPLLHAHVEQGPRDGFAFDVLHFHIDQFHFPLFSGSSSRTVTTLHGRQDLPDLKPLYAGFQEMPVVSISDVQRRPIINANFAGTAYHELPTDLLTPGSDGRGSKNAWTVPSRSRAP